MHLSFSPEPAFLTVTPNLSIFCNLKSKDFSNQVLVSFCVRVLLSISLFTLVFQHEEKQAACSVHVCACVVASVLTLWPCELACQTLSMGILQAGILEWVSKPSSRESSWSRDQTFISNVSCIGRQVLYHKHHLRRPRFPYYRCANIYPNSLKWARIQFTSSAMTADLGQSLALSSQSTQPQTCTIFWSYLGFSWFGEEKEKKTWLLLYYQKRKTSS